MAPLNYDDHATDMPMPMHSGRSFRSLDNPGAVTHVTDTLRATWLAQEYEVKDMDKLKAGYFLTAVDGGQTVSHMLVERLTGFPAMAVENEEKMRAGQGGAQVLSG